MAKGKNIVASGSPRGVFRDVLISGTPYPGMILQMKAAVAEVQGKMTYEVRGTTAGSKGEIAVYCPDELQGAVGVGAALTPGGNALGDIAVTGQIGRVYFPVMGEELNLVVGSVAGTADDVAIGDLFGVNNDGKLKANSSYTSAPFKACEVITDPTADYVMCFLYLGNNA